VRLLDAGPGDPPTAPSPVGLAPSLDGARGYLARHHLALLRFEDGRLAEAEAGWRAVLDEQPTFAPARVQLGDVFLARERWAELEQTVAALEADDPVAAALLRARGLLARGVFPEARRVLKGALARHPEAVWPRVLLTQALLREGKDGEAEAALRDVVRRDPGQVESWRNLAKLLWNQGRFAEAAAVCAEGRKAWPDEPDLRRLQAAALDALRTDDPV
jgi:predicted Zn-dependent protease